MTLRTRIGTACATMVAASLLSGGSAAFAEPGCPAAGTRGPCAVHASAGSGYLLADGFTPRSDVRFEIYRSEGGARIYGPETRRTDGFGQRNAPGNLDNLKAGNYAVVTDLATGTEKTLVLDPVRLTDVDYGADTVSGIATPNVDVTVAVARGSGDFFMVTTRAGADGRWQVDLGTFDLKPGADFSAVVNDGDNDATHAHAFETGCGSVGFCVLYTDMTNDVIGADHMSPDSDVRFEVFRSGHRILDPVTVHTDNTGGAEIQVGFDHGIDLVSGDRVTARDIESGVTKHVRIVSLSITLVDPSTEVVEGTAPAGSTVGLGGSGPKPFDLQAGPGNVWSFDFDTIGYDVTQDEFFSAVIFDEDSDNGQPDWVKAQRGTPAPQCVQDETTICGTSAAEALHGQPGSVGAAAATPRGAAAARRLTIAAGGRNDTVITTMARRTSSVTINTGTGKLDRVVVRARKRARGNVHIDGRSRSLVVVLPAHAWGIEVNVSGTEGADRVGTRRFGGSGGSGGSYRIAGKGGRDVLRGGDGTDVLIGGAGRDTCFADPDDTVRSCEVVKR
ncbi:MAG: hypothetical protein ACRDJY_12000 [Thermoleophilaceae bacterium]